MNKLQKQAWFSLVVCSIAYLGYLALFLAFGKADGAWAAFGVTGFLGFLN